MTGASQLHIKLAGGVSMPAMAFGTGTTWFKRDPSSFNSELVQSIKQALRQGFRHIDTAETYNTEQECGIAIQEFVQESGVPRSDIFVTSKLYSGLATAQDSVRTALRNLRLDYIDLYLVHSPFFDMLTALKQKGFPVQEYHGSVLDAWRELEKMVDAGLVKSIGVSNYRIEDFEAFLPHARIKPVVNQVEFNPYLQQPELVAYCKKHGIAIAAYSPLMPLTRNRNDAFLNVVTDIAAESKQPVTEAQVLLKWNLLKGNALVTTSAKPERLAEYLAVGDVHLSSQDVQRIDEAGSKVEYKPSWGSMHVQSN
ncbi:hypothetical protein RI367_002993 [Sorochytrium milnesiophthora]